MDIILWIGRILYSGLLIFMGLNHFMQLENMAQYAAAKNVPKGLKSRQLTRSQESRPRPYTARAFVQD